MWIQTQRYLNPDIDIVLIDSNTDSLWTDFVPSLRSIERIVVADGEALPPLKPGLNWVTFPDNIGHMGYDGQDGWGRAFCRGLQYGIDHNYDCVVHTEADLLTRIPAKDMVKVLEHFNLGAVAHLTNREYMCEVGHMAIRTDFIKQNKFLERYNPPELLKLYPHTNPEHWVEFLMAGGLLYYNWKGGRCDGHYPDKPIIFLEKMQEYDFITHAPYHIFYEHFMRLNFPELNWQPLYPEMEQKLWHWI